MRSNSQQQQSIPQLKETIHKLQQRDASYRLEISKLKKLLLQKDQDYQSISEELEEMRRIQLRDSQYIMKIDSYVTTLKAKLHKANLRIGQLESKLSSSRVKSISQNEDLETFQTEPSIPIQTFINQMSNHSNQTRISNKPKLICKPVKYQLPYPNVLYTEQQDIAQQNGHQKVSHLQEQILNRILDDEEFSANLSQQLASFSYGSTQTNKNTTQTHTFTCNSRQSNFSFANSEKKQNANEKSQKGSNRQYHSVSVDDKENNSKYFN